MATAKILRQIEYYFSDTSFPFDEFLKGLAKEEGKDGFVDISVIAGAQSQQPTCFFSFVSIVANDDKIKSQSSDLGCISSTLSVRRPLFPKHRCN